MVIMVCYEGTSTARRAVKLARAHAAVWDASVVIVKALERDEPLKRSYIEKEERKLESEIAAIITDAVIPYECQLFISSLGRGEQLVEFARTEKVDQVFIGVERRSKLGKLIFGSTAQFVILNAPCPVVTVNSRQI